MFSNRPADRLGSNLAGSLITGAMLILLLSVIFSSCRSRRAEVETVAAANQSVDGPSDLRNVETNVKITVPEGWIAVGDSRRRTDDIYATYPEEQLYAAVLSESKTVLAQFDLENNAEQYRLLIRNQLDEFDGETRTGLTRVDGDPAVQYEIRGEVDGVSVVYLHTTIEGENNYYQVVGWTTASSYADNKAPLTAIVNSFRGT
jgi:hypothetical protein